MEGVSLCVMLWYRWCVKWSFWCYGESCLRVLCYCVEAAKQSEIKKTVLTSSTSVLSLINGGIISEQKETHSPYTLVGPTVTRPEQDSLTVLILDNQLYINCPLLTKLIRSSGKPTMLSLFSSNLNTYSSSCFCCYLFRISCLNICESILISCNLKIK